MYSNPRGSYKPPSQASQLARLRKKRFAQRTSAIRSQKSLVTGISFGGKLLQRMPITGFPEMMETRLRYNMYRSFSTNNSTGQDVYQFKINSVFDPDQTGAGHQPLYRDQLYTIYKYAVVTGCRYTVEVSTTTITGVIVLPQVTTYVTTDSDTSTAIERGSVKRTWIQLGKPGKITGYVDMKSMFGLPRTEDLLIDDLYRHDSSADPSQVCYLSLYSQDTESAQSRVSYSITLDYTVVFKEVVKIATS